MSYLFRTYCHEHTVRSLSLLAACSLMPLHVIGAQAAPRLGTIDFPTSGSAAAQPAFIRGVLFLHSFEYAAAAAAFREAQRQDPGFVMAYWGEAMTFTHAVWNQQDLDSARLALVKLGATREARLARATTPRERAYLTAVETLYGEGSKPRRDTLYAGAMQRMMEQFPDDMEARSFTALAILGLNQAIRSVPDYMRAAALVEPVFARNPDHPGAAHYLIHAFDDPDHAPLGLPAARAYSRIAPDAAHAQHMTTHIYLALGMWADVVSQNVIAMDLTRAVPGHYTWWLGYGLLQQGRYVDALRHLERVRAGMSASLGQRSALMGMRGEYLINTERWTAEPGRWFINIGEGSYAVAVQEFVRGFVAAKRGDTSEAGFARGELVRRTAAVRDTLEVRALGVMDLELRAVLRRLEGANDDAIALLREATRAEDALPVDFGPPGILKPSHELLGDLLLDLGRPAEAKQEYTRALALAPGRARSLIGLVRAAAAAGDRETAEAAYRQLAANWRQADGDLTELRALRTLVAAR